MIDYRKLYSKYDKEDLVNTCANLKQNKERLRKEVNRSYIVCDEKDKEIERLNNIINKKEQFLGDNIKRLEREVVKRDNIINELEVFLKEGTELVTGCGITREYIYAYDNVLDKLQELKGSDKE